MQDINKVLNRIEQGNPIVINFDYDEFSRSGSLAKAIGLNRYHDNWFVEVEFKAYRGSSDSMTLDEYMENTKDIS